MPKSKAFVQGRTKPREFGGHGYDGGKPCPTCYTPMERAGSSWTCTKHGAPRKP